AGRPTGLAADQVRASHQPDRRQGARSNDSRVVPAARRRDDRIMKRREFITLLGGAAAAWPLVGAGAQQAGKTWRIGYVTHVHNSAYDPLFGRLRELGYVEGRNVIIERRYA